MKPITRPTGPPESVPPRRLRVLVACLLTIWLGLQLLTMVVAAVRGGETSLAFGFLYAGMFTALLGFSAWRAWAWVARWPDVAIRSGAGAPPLTAVHEPPETHRGLSGKEPPPARW